MKNVATYSWETQSITHFYSEYNCKSNSGLPLSGYKNNLNFCVWKHKNMFTAIHKYVHVLDHVTVFNYM